MTQVNEDRKGTAYAVTVDARDVKATGISAEDRARTIRVLATRPPSRATSPGPATSCRCARWTGGVLRRAGHTEAAVDLARLAGLDAGRGALRARQRRRLDDARTRVPRVRRRARPRDDLDRRPHRVPSGTPSGRWSASPRPGCRPSTASSARSATASRLDGVEHVALVHGDIGDGEDVLVRVHSECLTGDVFGSLRCDCGPQLQAALRRVAAEGRGVVLYMRGHEGRGIGLLHKLRAYAAAGRRRRHRRRQPRTRAAGRRARLRHRCADPRRPRRAHACGC